MKATTWLCPVLTLLCATSLVCTAQRGGYPLDYADSNMIQDDYLLDKRNKPSLSIVNPLDVLRQRLLLEIARRQMKENTRQVELNRAILKNVGKRTSATRRYQQALQQAEEEQQQQNQPMLEHQRQQQRRMHQHFPNQQDYVPATSIFDFLQRRPAFDIDTARYTDANANEDGDDETQTPLDDAKKSLDNASTKHQSNGNEIANERNHDDVKGAATVAGAGGLTMDLLGDNDLDSASDTNDGDFKLGYLYRLHRNHFTKK